MENNNTDRKVNYEANWEKFKTASVKFLDRRKHSKQENIRLAVIVLAVVFIIGVFCPLLGATMKFSMMNSTQSKEAKETVIFEPQNDVIKFSAGDLVFHQPLREFELFGTELGDMNILGLNLYDTLTTPMPDYDGLKDAENSLKSGPITALTAPWFVDFCNENLGDFGKNVVEIGASVKEIADVLGDALGEITDVLDDVKVVSDGVREDIQDAEDLVNNIETAISIVFAIIIALIIFVILWKKPNYVVPSVLTFFSVVFLAIEAVVIIINAKIHEAITTGMNDLSASISDTLNEIMPGLSDMLVRLTSADDISFIFTGSLYTGIGWWLSTIALVGITVLAFVQVKMAKGIEKAVEETGELAGELTEELTGEVTE